MHVEVSNEVVGKMLKTDVRNPHGQVLLAQGSIISDKHLRVFRMWGIRAVRVQEGDETTRQPTSRSLIEKAMVSERKRFKHCDIGHPAMHQVYLYSVKKRTLTLAETQP
jgi:hypothetical protein